MTTAAPASTRPLVCGIDYNSKALDVALLRGRELISTESYALGRDLSVQVGVIARLCMALVREGVAVVVMERPFLPLNTGRGVASSLLIREVAIRVETLAVASGLKVVFVAPNTWHAVVLGDGSLRSAEAKQAALLFVDRAYGLRTTNHNAADSVCLASWAASTIRLEQGRRQL